MIIASVGWWVNDQWVCGSVAKWSVVSGLAVGGSGVGGFIKTQIVVDLLLLSDNPLDFHAIVVSVSPVDILKVLEFVEIFNELMIKQLKTNVKSFFNCFSFFVGLYQ